MTNKETERRLRQAFSHAVPDVLDSVLSDQQREKGTVIFMKETKRRNPWVTRGLAIAAAFVLLIVGAVGFRAYRIDRAVDSTVSLDVNPGVEITVNQKNRVLAVTPRNKDGETVIGAMDFAGSDLDVAVNALIGSMLRNGYLSELANSILISVDNDDPQAAQTLQQKLSEDIRSLLKTNAFNGAVLSQTVTADESLQALAEQHGISVGKAQLIRQIAAANPLRTFEQLAPLSINELNLLARSAAESLDQISSVGEASDKAYIGDAKARETALAHAGVTADAATMKKVELDYDDGVMVYEVEFHADGFEYEYEINAVTAEILQIERDANKSKPSGSTTTPSTNGGTSVTSADSASYIPESKAKELALAHAAVAADAATMRKVELERDDGITVYEVDFVADGYEYDYEVNAVTGEIVRSGKEQDDDTTKATASAPSSANDAARISEAKAKELALAHAGCAEADIQNYRIESDRDDGVAIYEIEFRCGGYDYDYDINAQTGSILKYDKERDD